MSEVFQLNEVADLPAIQFYSGGAVYDPSPAPTATVYAPDGTPSTPALTKQGSGTTTRFLLVGFTEAIAGEYQVNYQTADAAADFPGYTDYVRVGQTWLQYLSADLLTLTSRIGAFTGTGVNTVLGFFRALLRSDLTAPSDVGGTFDPATDSTQAIADTISGLPTPPTLSQIVNGVWNELLAGHTTPNSAAQYLIAAGSGSAAPTVSQIVNGVLNELLAGHTTPGSVAVAISLINAVYAAVQTIGAGVTYVRTPVSLNADTELRQGVRYTGVYALHYTSDSAADLLAAGITVALNFAGESFPASSVVGSAGDWDIYIPIDETETADIPLGTYAAQLALFDGAVELPELSNFNVTMAVNP